MPRAEMISQMLPPASDDPGQLATTCLEGFQAERAPSWRKLAACARAAIVNTLLRGERKDAWQRVVAALGDQLRGRGLGRQRVRFGVRILVRFPCAPRPCAPATRDFRWPILGPIGRPIDRQGADPTRRLIRGSSADYELADLATRLVTGGLTSGRLLRSEDRSGVRRPIKCSMHVGAVPRDEGEPSGLIHEIEELLLFGA